MFEEKIKLDVKKVDNVVTKQIHGQEFKFNKYLDQISCEFVINQCLESFIKKNNEEMNYITAMNSALQTMNICLCYLTTNIEIEDIAYEDLYIMGIFKTIEETLINYQEIKSAVISCVGLMFDYVIYDALNQLPTNTEMVDNLQKIQEVFKSNPEKAKEFANIVIANHPELKSFGETFEKILTNFNKKE